MIFIGVATNINSKIGISTGSNPCELELEIKSSSFVADGLANPLRYYFIYRWLRAPLLVLLAPPEILKLNQKRGKIG